MMFSNNIITVARQKHDKQLEARVLLAQSSRAYRMGDEISSLNYACRALKLTSPADSNTYTQSSTMIAYMLSRQGKNVEALKTGFKILRETDAWGWKKLSIGCRACISDLYRSIGNPQAALPYALRASSDAKTLKDSSLYIFTLSTLSNLYSDRRIESPASLIKATAYMEIILAPPYLRLLSSFDQARYLSNLGRLYIKQHDFILGEKTLLRSIAISHQEKYTPLEKTTLNELMSLCIDKGLYRKAIKYGRQAVVAQAEAQSDRVLQRNIFDHLSEAYVGIKDYEQAFNYAQKANMLNDSILAANKARDAAELDKKYLADKRLLIAGSMAKLLRQQRNFIIVLALIVVMSLIAVYRWLIYKRKKETLLLAREHRQLEKLDVLKTRFFANISHELRTPLTLIIGPAGQLLNKQIEDEHLQQDYLLGITRNGEKLLNLVNELLDLGKLEAGKLWIRPKPVALLPVIKEICHSFSAPADRKKISYHLVCDIKEHLFIQLDQEKFEKICNNLIGNAIKFTPLSGSITLVATITPDFVEFSVANTGFGIHPDDLPYIFDRYYQGHQEELTYNGGTGIGLAIAYEFAELMDGSLIVENTWGEGTTFKLSIPLIYAEQHTFPMPDRVVDIDVSGQSFVDNKQLVMIVEDNIEMAGYITSILQPAYILMTAHNGVEALHMLRSMIKLPSLIISDVMMPEMDGFALLKILKQNAVFCTIPVIMLTALADTRHKLKALNIGVDDYIVKPFLNDELIARATNLINNSATRFKVPGQKIVELTEAGNGEGIEPASSIEEDVLFSTSPADLTWLSTLENQVRIHIGKTDLNLTILSDAMSVSERQLFRRIKAITGLTPNKYIRAIRLQIAREAIESGRYRTIAEISYAAGFDTPAYFSKLFKEHYGRNINELM